MAFSDANNVRRMSTPRRRNKKSTYITFVRKMSCVSVTLSRNYRHIREPFVITFSMGLNRPVWGARLSCENGICPKASKEKFTESHLMGGLNMPASHSTVDTDSGVFLSALPHQGRVTSYRKCCVNLTDYSVQGRVKVTENSCSWMTLCCFCCSETKRGQSLTDLLYNIFLKN